MWTLIACATSNVHTTERVGLPLCNVHIRSGYCWYCSSAYQTGSPMCSEFTHIISTECDRNQVLYCSHSKAHNFAKESSIEKIKVPFWSAINVFSDGVLISVSTKCGEWVVYPERVTYNMLGPTWKYSQSVRLQWWLLYKLLHSQCWVEVLLSEYEETFIPISDQPWRWCSWGVLSDKHIWGQEGGDEEGGSGCSHSTQGGMWSPSTTECAEVDVLHYRVWYCIRSPSP